MNKILFTSLRGDWKTPRIVYQILDSEFNFDYDPCPTDYKVDGLESEWGSVNYVNPPYGKDIGKWVKKGFEEYKNGKVVVFLIPSRTDTSWWHDYIMKADEIRFIKGRLKFDDQKGPAPFPSAIVVFNAKKTTEEQIYDTGWNDAVRNNAKVVRTKGKRVIDEKTLKALNNLADMVDMCNKHKIPLAIRNKTKGRGCEGFCEKCEKDILKTVNLLSEAKK